MMLKRFSAGFCQVKLSYKQCSTSALKTHAERYHTLHTKKSKYANHHHPAQVVVALTAAGAAVVKLLLLASTPALAVFITSKLHSILNPQEL